MELLPGLLEGVLERSNDAVTVTEATLHEQGPRIVYVNRAFETMTGYCRDEVLGQSLQLLQGPATEPAIIDRLRKALKAGEPFEGEAWCYRKDGQCFLMYQMIDPVTDDAGHVTHFIAIQKDVTLSRARRRRREHLETVLGLQREVAAGGLDLLRVRQRIVDAAMEISGADAAVVEEPEGEELVYRAVAGSAGESLGIHLPMANTLSGMSFQRREVLRTDDTASDPRVELKEAARQIGFISGLLIPLIHQNHCYGVLKVYSSELSRFGDEDRQLLELASSILASALFNAASFDEELRRRSELLDSIPMLVSYVDRDRRYQEVNAAYEEWFEIEATSIRGRRVEDVVGEAAYERIRPHVDAALRGEPVSFEATLPYRKGGERTVLAQYRSHFSRRGEVLGFYAVVSDLTQLKEAEQDFLTGLWNRRKCEEKAGEMLQAVARYGHAVSVMLLDVDHFKIVNDQYGHLCGDEVLKDLGEYLKNTVRGVDVVGRWGGEEFIILAPETVADEARKLAERICNEIRRQSFGGLDNVTISIGVTQAGKGESLEQIIGRADTALYRAKGAGRDRFVVAETGAE